MRFSCYEIIVIQLNDLSNIQAAKTWIFILEINAKAVSWQKRWKFGLQQGILELERDIES